MNACSDLDAIAAVQVEDITDAVLYETELDTIIARKDVKYLPRRTPIAFVRMVTPEVSSSTGPSKVHEIYCLGIISDIISSEIGHKYAIIHEDEAGKTAMSSFRDGESKVFGLNDEGIWQFRFRLKAAFGDGVFDSLRPFRGYIEQMSPDTLELVPTTTTDLVPTGTTVKDVKEASRKKEASRGLRTSFFNNLGSLNQLVKNFYDFSEDSRIFTAIQKKLQHTGEHLEGFKSNDSTLSILSFNFMPINPRSKYSAKDLANHFTFKDLLFPHQLDKPLEDHGTLQEVVKNFRMLMTELMTNQIDKQRWNNILTPIYNSFDSQNPQTSIKTAEAEDVYNYLQETFRDMVIFLTDEHTEKLSADEIETRLKEIWTLDTERLLVYSMQAKSLRDARKRALDDSDSSAASSKQGAKGSAGSKKTQHPRKSLRSSAATSATENNSGKELCLSDATFAIRNGVNTGPCKYGTKCRFKHVTLAYMKKNKKEIVRFFEAANETPFRNETIAMINEWPNK